MPTRPRDRALGIHHIWVNATGNGAYYLDDVDRVGWLRLFVHTLTTQGWTCIAFCQMTTHVHMLLDLPDASISDGMHRLNLEYSKQFNERHARAGTLLRKRYGSRRVQGADDLLGSYAYAVLNPVVEGMCPRAEDWRWSSYGTTIGLSSDFPFVDASLVLDELGGSVDRLREFIAGRSAG